MDDCETLKPLLMGLMDGELTPDQITEVNRHLNRCRSCRQEYDELAKACDPLRELTFEEPGQEQLERLWNRPFSRLTRNTGLIMVALGWLVLMGYVALEVARDRSAEMPVKVGLAAMAVGLVILFLNVLSRRIADWKHDPYKEVDR